MWSGKSGRGGLVNRLHKDKVEGYKVLDYVDGYLPFNWTWQEMSHQ